VSEHLQNNCGPPQNPRKPCGHAISERVHRARAYGLDLAIGVVPPKASVSILDQWLQRAARIENAPCIPTIVPHRLLGEGLLIQVRTGHLKLQLQNLTLCGGKWVFPRNMFVLPGDWDLHARSVDDHWTFRSMSEVLSAQGAYRRTSSFNDAVQRLAQYGPFKFNGRWIRDLADLETYFETYICLARSIEERGFKSPACASASDGHVGVAVTRDGQLMHFRTGHHRLALAKGLGVSVITAKVHVVHQKWLANVIAGSALASAALVAAVKGLSA
jgi:hypothetical protein